MLIDTITSLFSIFVETMVFLSKIVNQIFYYIYNSAKSNQKWTTQKEYTGCLLQAFIRITSIK